jgi:ribosomal protein L4
MLSNILLINDKDAQLKKELKYGSTRKIKKKTKGTGTARSSKNPLFKGGGTVFDQDQEVIHSN